jgi:hypothetical protein
MIHYLPSKRTALLLVVAMMFGLGNHASAQWSTDFFNTNNGWVRDVGVVGQNTSNPAAERWQGNDPYNAVDEVGETDAIAFATGYTPGGSGGGNSSLIQGGAYLFADIFPGRSDVKLWRSFAPLTGGSVTFSMEWSLIGSLDPAFANLDTFAFDLRTFDNSQSLLKLDLNPSVSVQLNSYSMQSVVDSGAGIVTDTLIDLAYQALFVVDVEMTGSTYDLSLTQLNASTRATIATWDLVTGGVLSDGRTAEDFGTVSIDWVLTSNNPEEPGSNYMIVNDVSVVPEPSTYALLVMAALGAAYWARRRRCR